MSIANVVGKLFSWISRAFAFARVTLANLLVVLVVVLVVWFSYPVLAASRFPKDRRYCSKQMARSWNRPVARIP